MDLETLKALFEAHLSPVKSDIKELKDGQQQILDIMQNQARQEIEIINIKKDVDECSGDVKKMKDKGNNRLWRIIELGIAGSIGAIVGKFF